MKQLAGITNKTIKSLGLPFLHHEQVQSETTIPVIIAHGGYWHDFPILLANCMKHDYDFHITALAKCMYVDSMRVLQNGGGGGGYRRPCLDALWNGHSAFEDAEILMTICKSKSEIFNQQYGFTFENVLHHLDKKLPL